VDLAQGPLSLVSTFEVLLGRKSSGSGLETENTAVGISHADHVASSIRKSWLTAATSGGSSVGTVRSRTQNTKFSLVLFTIFKLYFHKHLKSYLRYYILTYYFSIT
jgi:hypothetical protein